MSVINTNITSLIGQSNLLKSQNALSTSMQRLSSGLRINSAKDDAAGQAIANRMTSQITGLQQAQRNANDGISAAQTAEGALNQINDNLQRIRELSVQSQNGTNSQEDLDSIQNEIGQRLNEINRISEETSFNGTKVLASDQTLTIQVGANDSETIAVNLSKIDVSTLNLEGFNVNDSGEVANDAATADDLVLAGFTKAGSANANGSYTYTNTSYTNNTRMDSSHLMARLSNGATIDLGATTATGYTTHAGSTAIGYDTPQLTYNSTEDHFTYAVTGASATSAATNLVPGAGEDPIAVTIKINGATDNFLIDADGNITGAAGEALFIDGSGNLTATTTGANTTYAKATVENLTAIMAGAASGTGGAATAVTIKAADGATDIQVGTGGAAGVEINGDNLTTAIITLTDSGTTFTGTAGTGINVAGAIAEKSAVAGMLATSGGDVDTNGGAAGNVSVVDSAGATQTTVDAFTVAAGGLVEINEAAPIGALVDGDALYVDADGNLTEAATTTATFYAQESGVITDDTGLQLYKDADGALTTDATTAGERTENPLGVLDNALKQVDSLRSDLGAIQNRFDSAITNLSTTATNLSAARSRIQDADYAVEVANMTRAQILQQAGTSVLAQANQVPQGVLSLLR